MSKIMSVNAGSSSLKFQLLEMTKSKEEVITEGQFEKIGLPDPNFKIKFNGKKEEHVVPQVKDHADAVAILLDALVSMKIVKDLKEIKGVGHRVLHCGEKYNDSFIMDDTSIAVVESVCDLGPLHNPANLIGIRAFMKALPGVVNVGVFDTSFHLTMPDEAYMYAVPYEWYEKYSVRKYGFHGTSHKYVSLEAAKMLGKKSEDVRLITCHIGNGASCAAVKYGKVVDTSMGLTPLDGLVMGTRSGTIDPAVIQFICKHENLTVEEVTDILNKKSGFKGFTGNSDARAVREMKEQGNYRADLILRMQEKKICDYIGSYYVYMGGADAIIFTAGIGENSCETRENVCNRISEALGVKIDNELNAKCVRGVGGIISTPDSKIKVLVIPTNEELMIARDVIRVGKVELED